MIETENTCVVCGKVIPEGRQVCPMCGTTKGTFPAAKPIGVPGGPGVVVGGSPTRNVLNDDQYSKGYADGFNEGMKHACEVRTENERLKRENAFLRGRLEAGARIDDIDGEYE